MDLGLNRRSEKFSLNNTFDGICLHTYLHRSPRVLGVKLGFKKGMVVASLNIRGLNTHNDELRLLIRDKGIHVPGIDETQLGEGFPDHLVSIDLCGQLVPAPVF